MVSKGANVTLYIQAKGTAQKFSKHQVERIEKFPDSIITEFAEVRNKDKTKEGSLVVYEYDPPASFRAVSIDNKILAVGWYVYTYIDKETIREKQKYQKYPDDDIKLLGHNQPGELLYYGSREYDVMNELLEHLVENFDKHTKLTNKKPVFVYGL